MDELNQKREELRKEFQQRKKEIIALRSRLNTVGSQKKETFLKLNLVKDAIKDHTKNISSFKKKRNELTKQVKILKEKRDLLNLEVKQKASQRGKVDHQKEQFKKSNIKESPSQIKTQINNLEKKIETEVIPFSQEQRLRKEIKILQAQFKELSKLDDIWKEANSAAADFAGKRRKAQESHQEVQKIAQESQEKHQKISHFYEEIKKSKDEEQLLSEQYLQLKVQSSQIKNELEETSKRIKELAKIFDVDHKKSFKVKVQEKTAQVQEKLRQGKKLSTEDILAFQALKE